MGFAMRPNDPAWPLRYHRGTMDLNWQRELRLSFQMPAEYEQKVETGDPIRFQVKSTSSLSRSLQIINCRGKVITSLTPTKTATYPGDLAPDGLQYAIYHYAYADWKNLNGLGDIFKGVYHFVYTVQYNATTTEVYISEPFNIQKYHPDTVLLECTHTRYYQGSPFDVIPAIYRFRFEGYTEDFQPRSASTVFNDQQQNVKVLDYNPYRVQTLFIGEPTGAADWVFDKINRIMGCSQIMIDGKRITLATGGAGMSKEVTVASPQKTGSIEIQDAIDGEGFTSAARRVLLWTSPAVYPYVISGVTIAVFAFAGPKKFLTALEETNFITFLNSELQKTELLGTITKSGNDIFYNNAPGETISTSSVTVYTRSMLWDYADLNPIAFPLIANLTVGNFDGVMVWGDGSIERFVIGSVPTTISHEYASIDLFHLECWHVSCGYFRLNQKHMEKLTGAGPTNGVTFILNTHVLGGAVFPFALLQDSKNTLEKLDIQYNSLTSVSNMATWKWSKLKTLYFDHNAFPSAVMNQILVDCDNNAKTANVFSPIRNGEIGVSSQTPPAALASNGSAARASLITLGWSVLV